MILVQTALWLTYLWSIQKRNPSITEPFGVKQSPRRRFQLTHGGLKTRLFTGAQMFEAQQIDLPLTSWFTRIPKSPLRIPKNPAIQQKMMQPQPYPRAVPPSCLTTVAGHEPSVICPNWIAT